MNIVEALRILELNGAGKIHRDDYAVKIFRWSTDTWDDFKKHRVKLNIGDLVALDWEHETDKSAPPIGDMKDER